MQGKAFRPDIMELNFEKQVSDVRGAILFLKYGSKSINIVEIKKGFSRGGHYHSFETKHHILSGTIEYKEKNIQTNHETIKIICAPAVITVPSLAAHLLTALDDTLFAEEIGENYRSEEHTSELQSH